MKFSKLVVSTVTAMGFVKNEEVDEEWRAEVHNYRSMVLPVPVVAYMYTLCVCTCYCITVVLQALQYQPSHDDLPV